MPEERARMSSVLGATGLVLGNVQGQGDFEVRGRVQGDIVLDGRVLVAIGGLVLGTIEAVSITVSGTVRGDLIAEDGVEISGSGQVEGNVTSPRVAIEAGAKVRGHLRTGEEAPAAVRGAERPVPDVPAAIAPDVDETPEDGDDEAELDVTPAPPLATREAADLKGPGGKRRRRRRRGAERERTGEGERQREAGSAPREAGGAPREPGGTRRVPPARPTRPSGPLALEASAQTDASAKAEAAPREAAPREAAPRETKKLPPGDGGPDKPRRSKPLPTFVKGARGHLRS